MDTKELASSWWKHSAHVCVFLMSIANALSVWPAFTVTRIARTDAAFTRRYLKLSSGETYWHVHAVAIDESLRGQGHGTLLLRELLRELDRRDPAATAPVLLSTQRERNLRLYSRAGFELLTSETIVGCRSWFMRRRA